MADAPTLHGISALTIRDLNIIDPAAGDVVVKSSNTVCPINIATGEAECAPPDGDGDCAPHGGDTDGDGLCDDGPGDFCTGGANTGCKDNCKFISNPNQEDRGGLPNPGGPDGKGDACQCGDVTGDGNVNGTDATFITRKALDLFSPLFGDNCPNYTNSCTVDEKGNCLP
jgi:hypothetical protein